MYLMVSICRLYYLGVCASSYVCMIRGVCKVMSGYVSVRGVCIYVSVHEYGRVYDYWCTEGDNACLIICECEGMGVCISVLG